MGTSIGSHYLIEDGWCCARAQVVEALGCTCIPGIKSMPGMRKES
jgi:hypothetical protein